MGGYNGGKSQDSLVGAYFLKENNDEGTFIPRSFVQME